jgi:uncharacterized membrane protein
LDDVIFILCLVGAIGSGLNAGVFFAFSTFTMSGLGRLPAAQGMAAMQAINVAAPRSALFMLLLFGTGLIALALAVEAAIGLDGAGATMRLAGGIVYVAGAIVVTVGANVPRNDALAAADPAAADSAALWAGYRRSWVAWNHVRTLACLAAAVLFTLAPAGPAAS